MPTPNFLFAQANLLALLGWLLLALAPRWRFTRWVVLSGAAPLALAAAYGAFLAGHYLGPQAGQGGFGSLAQVRALFLDPWSLLAGWVHYLCFDLWLGAWQVRDAQRRGLPHWLGLPALLATFLAGPLGLLLYVGLRAAWLRQKPALSAA